MEQTEQQTNQHIDHIDLQYVTTNRLIAELEHRERVQLGIGWTPKQCKRLWQLAMALNPVPPRT